MIKKQKSSKNSKGSASLHLNEKWLRQKYLVEGLSTYQIAALVGRNPKNVYEKLKAFGIRTRSRAETIQKNSWWKLGKPARKGWKHTKEARRLIREKATGRPGLKGKENPMYGKRSPNWKGGMTPERQALYMTEEWKTLVKYVYARDKYTCQKCKTGHNRSNKLHAHHIRGWADYPELRKEPSNLVTLCNTCHQWVHSKANTKMEFIEGVTYRITSRGSSKLSK